MVTVGERTRHKQILARHANGAAAAQIEQRRFQSTEAFVQREDAFDFFVGKNESHDFKQFASTACTTVGSRYLATRRLDHAQSLSCQCLLGASECRAP